MQNTLTQKFLELATEYQEVQTSYKSKYQEKIERQYKIAKPDATQDEIEEAIESGDSSKVFANQILDSHLHQQVRTIYSSCRVLTISRRKMLWHILRPVMRILKELRLVFNSCTSCSLISCFIIFHAICDAARVILTPTTYGSARRRAG